MTSLPRYQVFVSSTYEDLREERQQATQAILEAGSFPAGMELFPASDDSQWELIKRVIAESDYYVVILGGRYGSIGPSGLSYTEMEYDYAVSKGIPILGFVRGDEGNIPAKFSEATEASQRKFRAFKQKVMSRTCRKYTNPQELGMAVLKSLVSAARIHPRTGWVRADQARSHEDEQRERTLREELEEASKLIEELGRELRDRAVLGMEIPKECLAQGDDEYEFLVTYRNNENKEVPENVPMTWNDIFRTIGVDLYGYIKRKSKNWNTTNQYDFHELLVEKIRHKILDKVQKRKIQLDSSQIDQCVIQLKELGLLRFAEKEEEDGKSFRGITLTEYGERQLTLLSTQRRKTAA
jgi:hypothetical protein